MSKNDKKTQIGGQAVIEGVMMRGKNSQAIAVRAETGEILLETKRIKNNPKISKIPVIRGVVAFFNSLVTGTKSLMRSASVFGEDETSAFDDWLSKKLKIKAVDVASFLGVTLGLLLSLLLFFYLPQTVADLFSNLSKTSFLYCLIEGCIRIIIFVLYILLVSFLKDIKRTFMYHGAEHKTISCFENGLELNVENVKKCSRLHDRCGTTFTFLVMLVSILVFALVNAIVGSFGVQFTGFTGKILRFLLKLACLPIVAGVSYEFLKLLAKTKSKFFVVFKAPGLLLQRLTTLEPTDDMIEVAITSFKTVFEMDSDETIKEVSFNVFGTSKSLLEKVDKILKKAKDIEGCEKEWIVSRALNISRSELNKNRLITKEQNDIAIKYAEERIKGIPLSYVFGDMDFYGYTFTVNENVLIPRSETEELVMHAISDINSNSKVLDLCCGSGAIGITVALKTGAKVTLVDVSAGAIEVATMNAERLGASVNVIKSDMFSNVEQKFDVIISNPPYIKTCDLASLQLEVKKEPALALDGGETGLKFYEIIAKNASNFLNDNGAIYLECGYNQADDVCNVFKATNDFSCVTIIKDINGIDRIVKVVK